MTPFSHFLFINCRKPMSNYIGFVFPHFCFENNLHSQRYVTLITIKWAIIAFIFVFHSHLLKSSNEIFFGMKLLFIECDSTLKCLKTFRMESKSSNECAIFSTVTLYAKRKCTTFLTTTNQNVSIRCWSDTYKVSGATEKIPFISTMEQ